MSDVEDRLAALWAAGEPPARDPLFTLAVMEAVARRRLRRNLVQAAAVALAAAAVLWASAPVVEEAVAALARHTDLHLVGVASALLAGLWFAGGAPARRRR